MPDLENPQVNSSYHPDYEASPTDKNWFWMLGLIGVGVLLFVFADSIGLTMVRKDRGLGNNTYEWSPDKVREAALVIRALGGMCFLAGLVERIVIELIKLRLAITKMK